MTIPVMRLKELTGMNLEALFNIVLAALVVSTKPQQEEAAKNAAKALAETIKSSSTTIDDNLVKSVVLPNLDVFIAEFKAQLA